MAHTRCTKERHVHVRVYMYTIRYPSSIMCGKSKTRQYTHTHSRTHDMRYGKRNIVKKVGVEKRKTRISKKEQSLPTYSYKDKKD